MLSERKASVFLKAQNEYELSKYSAVKNYRITVFLKFFSEAEQLSQIWIVIWIALEILYQMQYVTKFQKKAFEESFPENRFSRALSPGGFC